MSLPARSHTRLGCLLNETAGCRNGTVDRLIQPAVDLYRRCRAHRRIVARCCALRVMVAGGTGGGGASTSVTATPLAAPSGAV